jgi:hypothetical protein
MTNLKSVAANFKKFILWSAGIVPSILEKCPTEQSKYFALGLIIPFIALLSCASFAYFLSHSLRVNLFFALFGGAFWAILVYCLERIILTAYRKGDKSLTSVILRFTLVIATSLVVGKPLVLSFFEPEITREMKTIARQNVTGEREAIKNRFQMETEKLEKENQDIQNRLDELKKDVLNKEKAVIGEIEGISGSGKSGFGIAAQQKETAFKEAKIKLEQYKKETADQLANNKIRLAEIAKEIEDQTNSAQQLNDQGDGIIARTEALFSLMGKNPLLGLTIVPILLILMLIELIPLTSKVFGNKGVYDSMLEAEEAKQIVEITERIEFEKANLTRSRELQSAIAERLLNALKNGGVESITNQNERRVAEILHAEALKMTEKEAFNRIANAIEEEKFGEALIIEVIGNDNFEFICELPKKDQKTLSLNTISGDIAKIAEKIGGKIQLTKAFSSAMQEISASLPLLAQIENDRKILLQFEPLGDA